LRSGRAEFRVRDSWRGLRGKDFGKAERDDVGHQPGIDVKRDAAAEIAPREDGAFAAGAAIAHARTDADGRRAVARKPPSREIEEFGHGDPCLGALTAMPNP